MLVVRMVDDIGPSMLGAIAASSVRSAARQRRARRADREPATSRDPGRLVSVDVVADGGATVGARCRFAEAELELRCLSDDVVRLTWGPGEPPIPWALAENPAVGGARPVVSVAVDGVTACVVTTPAVRVVVGGDGSVRFFAPGGAAAPARAAAAASRRDEDGPVHPPSGGAAVRARRAGGRGRPARHDAPAVEPRPRRRVGAGR